MSIYQDEQNRRLPLKKNTFNPFSHWIKHSIIFCFTWKIVVTLLGRYFVLVLKSLVMKSCMVVFRWFPVNWVGLLQPCSYFHNHSCHIYRLMIFSWSDKTWLEPIPCESTWSYDQRLKMMALLSWIDWNQ